MFGTNGVSEFVFAYSIDTVNLMKRYLAVSLS